jgi:hypothetical protein
VEVWADRPWPFIGSGFLSPEFIHGNPPVDPAFAHMLRGVSADTLHSTIQYLEDYGTRHHTSFQITRAAEWMRRRLAGMGYEDVFLQSLRDMDSIHFSSQNVVAVKHGTTRPQFRIIVGAHYDSAVLGQSQVHAPGADDNASGTAAVLELARMLAGSSLDATVEFVLFTAEEVGLYGSKEYAARIHEEDVPPEHVFCLNMDMIANMDDTPWKVKLYNDKLSRPMSELTANIIEAYSTITPLFSGPSAYSDHASFNHYGYSAIFVHEGTSHNRLHTDQDLLEYLNMDYAAEVVRTVLATILHVATLAEPPEIAGVSQVSQDKVFVEWEHSTDADVTGYYVEMLGSDGELIERHFTTENSDSLEMEGGAEMAWVRVRAEDLLGESEPSESVLVGTGGAIALSVAPNPARGRCGFELFVPGGVGMPEASLRVFDASGRLVRTLHSGGLSGGPHSFEWLGIYDDGDRAPDGIYFYRLEVDGVDQRAGKIVLVN